MERERTLDPEMARRYARGWQEVAAVEEEERRTRTVEERWRRLCAIYDVATELGIPFRKSHESDEIVRGRWAQLRRGLS